jgi:mRNA interferase MazF
MIPFPYSDLSKSKHRPALVLTSFRKGDFLLCQITSKQYDDLHALSIKEGDFLSGGLSVGSFISASKLFTTNEDLILGVACLIEMLSACLEDDTF